METGLGSLNINVNIPDLSSGNAATAVAALSSALGVSLPADFGQVTIMSAKDLVSYQNSANTFRAAGWALLALTLLLLALTIALSPNRRRTVAWLGGGTVIAIVLATVALRHITQTILDSISSDEAQNAARAIVAHVGGSLRHAGSLVAWFAAIVGVIAYLVGRPRWLTRIGMLAAATFARRPGGSPAEHFVAARPEVMRAVSITIAVIIWFVIGVDLLQLILVGVLLGLFLWWVETAKQHVTAS